jgi:hypothetical protein
VQSNVRLIEHAASNPIARAMLMPSTLDLAVVCMPKTSGDSTGGVSGFISLPLGVGFINRLRLWWSGVCSRHWRTRCARWAKVVPHPIAAVRLFGSRTTTCKLLAAVLSRRGGAASSLPNAGLAQR